MYWNYNLIFILFFFYIIDVIKNINIYVGKFVIFVIYWFCFYYVFKCWFVNYKFFGIGLVFV